MEEYIENERFNAAKEKIIGKSIMIKESERFQKRLFTVC